MAKIYNSICPECNGHVVISNGEYVCSSCGLVTDQFYEPALSALDTENKKSKGALGQRLHIVDGLGSYIDYHNTRKMRDNNGSILPLRKQVLFKRLKFRYNLYGRIKNHQTDYRIFRILNLIAARLQLPHHIRDTAAYHYRKIRQKNKTRIKNHVTMIAVCLILAIREYNTVALYTLKEICETFKKLGHRVSEKAVIRTALQLRINLGYNMKHRKSEDYISRLISTLSNNYELYKKIELKIKDCKRYWQKLLFETNKLLMSIPNIDRGGRNPYVFAAASIYAAEQKLARQENRKPILTQKEIAEKVKVAEYSIRDHFCSLLKKSIE
jgi:transcription initiation factor TFIIIB Brf1 subunit/transcription initiation factor TFIIB